jgi:hypothetical protein
VSDSDFEERLSRIRANAGQSHSSPASGEVKRTGFLKGIILAAVTVTAGSQLIKATNANYDMIRDQYGILAAMGLALASIALVVLGVVLFIRAIWPARETSAYTSSARYQAGEARPQVQTSAGARLFFSVFGLGLGALAAFIMFVGNAPSAPQFADLYDKETANIAFGVSFMIACALMFLATLVSFVGFFVRRLPLLRVLVFFILGAMLLFTGFNALHIHPANWPSFMAAFNVAFKNQIGE